MIYFIIILLKLNFIRLKNKNWINPVISLNMTINHVSKNTDILIFQSPEIFHCNNIIDYIVKNLKNNEYMVFNVFASPELKANKILKKLFEYNCSDYKKFFIDKINYYKYEDIYDDQFISKCKGWYQHHEYNNRKFHFLSAIDYKDFKNKVGGFCNEMKDGLQYDDDDLLL